MNELPLFAENGVPAGKLLWTQEGLYLQMEARTEKRWDGICRAYLRGEHGELLLGVLEPEGQGMVCRKRFAQPQLRYLGYWQGAVLRKNGERGWQPYGGEVTGNWGKRLLREGALFRRQGNQLLVALPYPPGGEFPFTELFCLAEIFEMGGLRYVVYTFSEEGKPMLRR